MGVKVKTTGLDKKRAAIRKLETQAQGMAMDLAKQAAAQFVYNFKTGIREGSFNLDKLKPATVQQKTRDGFPSPATPLYGKGGRGSYQEMMKAKKVTNGWSVAPRDGTHKRSGLPFDVLFRIHEFGKTFAVGRGKTTKIGSHTVKGMVRIPPRPAGRKAKEQTLKGMAKNNSAFKKAFQKAIIQGREDWDAEYRENLKKDFARVAEAFQ